MTSKQAKEIIEALHNCEFALYQIDEILVFILSCLLAGVVLYVIWYILIRFCRI